MVESLTSLVNVTLKKLMEDKDYDGVINKCTEALKQYPQSAILYIERSTAYQRKGAHGKAYKDTEMAIVAAYQSGKREKIGEAQLRRAIVLSNLKRYDDALFALDKAKEYSGKETPTMDAWRNKIKREKGSGMYFILMNCFFLFRGIFELPLNQQFIFCFILYTHPCD